MQVMGNPLNELVRRLNRTIEDFNEEFQGIIGDLRIILKEGIKFYMN